MTTFVTFFGYKTRSGHGGFPVGVGRTINGSTFSSDWTIDSRGDIVPSGTYGAFTTYSAANYTLTLDNGDTVAIGMLANAAHVKPINSGTNADTAGSFQLRTVLITEPGVSGAMVRGDTIWCRDGVFNPGAAFDQRIRLPLGGYGGTAGQWIKIKAENTALMLTGTGAGHEIASISIDNTLQTGSLFDADLWFEGHLGRRPYVSGSRTVGCFTAVPTRGNLSRVAFKNMRVCGTVINDTNGLANASGLSFSGNTDNGLIEDVIFHDIYNPYLIGGTDWTVRRVACVRASNDSHKASAPINMLVEDFYSLDKRYPVGTGGHPDHMQQSNTSLADGTWAGGIHRRLILMNGDDSASGAEDGQGDFSDDNPINALYDGTIVENLLSMHQLSRAMSHSNTQNGIFRRSTCLREETNPGKVIASWRGGINCQMTDVFIDDAVSETYSPTSGTRVPSGEVRSRVTTVDPAPGSIGITATKAAYAVAMQAPAYGVANQAIDPNTIPTWALINAAATALMNKFAPKSGVAATSGGMMNTDGTYRGALFPNGTWNDGSVYVDGGLSFAGGTMTLSGTWTARTAKAFSLSAGGMVMSGAWGVGNGGLAFSGGRMTHAAAWTLAPILPPTPSVFSGKRRYACVARVFRIKVRP